MDYQKHYNLLIDRARSRQLECYTESHHVVPRCMGGDDSKENLVKLTPEEHYIAHLLLVKIHHEHHGLVWAAIMMTSHHTENRSSNKIYGWLRRRYQQVAKARTGEKNGSHGTMWINKIGTTENKKIRKDEPIPEGWKQGRKVKDQSEYYRPCSICGADKRSNSDRCKKCFNASPSSSENGSGAKLNWTKIRNIRKEYNSGSVSMRKLADLYGVSKDAILQIVKNRTWIERH